MAGTYSQIYIHIVFAVNGRQNLIQKEWKDDLHKYIAGIIKGKEQKPIIVNGMPDHIHAFVGLKPAMRISDIARDMKNNSSNFINDHRFVKGKFSRRKGTAHFRTGIHKLSASTTIFSIRKNIINGNHSKKNILNFCKNLTFHAKINTCLTGLNNITPSRFVCSSLFPFL